MPSFAEHGAKTILEDYVMRNGLQKYLLVLLTVGLCALPAFGQGSAGSLSGTVTDPKGAVVAGATVAVKNSATNQEFSTQTNNDGAFSIPSLGSGVYTATITASGFKQAAVTDIKIDVGKASTINVELEIGSANETVTVVGGGELRLRSRSQVIRSGPISSCPNNSKIGDLANTSISDGRSAVR